MKPKNKQAGAKHLHKTFFLKKYWPIWLIFFVFIITLTGIVMSKNITKNGGIFRFLSKGIVYSPPIIPAIPSTSASAITSPPSSMEGINTHTELYSGTGADQDLITLGPKVDGYSISTPYAGKQGFEFELESKAPLLAPIDMTLIGFQNNSVKVGTGADGTKYSPFNDIVLYFESTSPDWPGVVIKLYHLYSSPLLTGHYQNLDCGDVQRGTDDAQVEGHLFFAYDDYTVLPQNNAEACQALIGRKVKRGEVIGYAGNVGSHSFASFCFKVPDKSISPIVKQGNRNLHWVQPASFFYWKSYSPDADFPSGVLAYPFEADGYKLPSEQRDINYKYAF